MIEIKNLYKSYKIRGNNKVEALKNITLMLPNKGMIFITGESGSGKSTLLNVLGMLDKPDQGDISVDGKNIRKFKNKEIDYYRNTYIGFIFQEYNLLDNFDVNENIEIALSLQNKKKDKFQIDQILNLVGLDGLGKRKVNELSGGQKQRVAIARAIIKDASIILADEPTGNLDSTNSEQIFSLLKEISKNKLVVVVTHDVMSASKYADRIIEIKDGFVVNDWSTIIQDFAVQKFSLIKSKLLFFKSIALSFSNLRKKKLKLAIITLLITLSLSMFGFFYQLTKFDVDRTHAETLVRQGENRIEINKKIKGKNFSTISPVITFTKNEIDEVKSKLTEEVTEVSKAEENNTYLEISFAGGDNPLINDIKSYAYYDMYPLYTLFLEYSQSQLEELKLIGHIPSNSNEIIINKVYADYIINRGLLIWGVDKNGKMIEEDYFPKSYEEIVNDNKRIVFGSSYLVISGIIDEDMSKYEELKTTLSDDMQVNPSKLYDEFRTMYNSKLSEVIVNKTFFDTINLVPNNIMPFDFYKIAYKLDDNRFYSEVLPAIIDKKINMFDGKRYLDVESLNDNEVIIGTAMLDELYGNEYSTQILEYIKSEEEKREQLIKEREAKIKEIEEQLEINPEYVYKYPNEVPELDIKKLVLNFTENYINQKQLIGKSISVEVNDLYLRTQDVKTKLYENFVIVGYSPKEVYSYFSKTSIFKNYMRDNKETISIYFYEDNLKRLESIFDEFPSKNAKYISKTVYSKTMEDVSKVVKNVSVIASYFSIFALVFSIILFIYFTITSVNSNKKTIGILRALGAKVSDIYKIFYLESFIVGLFAFILSVVVCYFSVIVANQIISSNLFINVSPIIFRGDIILKLLVLLIVLTSISFVIPIFKISKTRPIDIINDK